MKCDKFMIPKIVVSACLAVEIVVVAACVAFETVSKTNFAVVNFVVTAAGTALGIFNVIACKIPVLA